MQKWRRYLFLTWVNGGIFSLVGIPAVFKFSFFWPIEFLAVIVTVFSLLGWGVIKLWNTMEASIVDANPAKKQAADAAGSPLPNPAAHAAGPVITPTVPAAGQPAVPPDNPNSPPTAGTV